MSSACLTFEQACVPGNELVIATQGLIGKMIRVGGGLRYSHVEVIVAHDRTVGAVPKGVREHSIEEVLSWGRPGVIVAPPLPFTPARMDRMQELMRRYVREIKYDFGSIFFHWVGLETSSKMNCAEVGMYAWDTLMAGHPDWPLPGDRLKSATPDDVRMAGRLVWSSDEVALRPAEARAMKLAAPWALRLEMVIQRRLTAFRLSAGCR